MNCLLKRDQKEDKSNAAMSLAKEEYLVAGLLQFLFVVWRVLARRWLTTVRCQLTEHLRETIPPRSCPRLLLTLMSSFTFGILLSFSRY